MLFSWIADLLDKSKTIMLTGIVIICINIPITLSAISDYNLKKFFVFQTFSCLGFAALTAPLNVTARMFATNRRVSGPAISYGAGSIIFGGFTPMICSLLNRQLGYAGEIIYLLFCQLLALIAIYYTPDISNKSKLSSDF